MVEELRAMGGLSEAKARVHRPRTLPELRELLSRESSPKLTLVAGRHSFGEHFLPTAGGEAVDTTTLPRFVRELETDARGMRWVRASANTTFEELAHRVAGFLPRFPPTSDLITLGGALVACSHDSRGYFLEDVRRFTVLTPDGAEHDCHAGAPGRAGELFRLVPGSFGALGVVIDLELALEADDRWREIVVADYGPYRDGFAVRRLEKSFEEGNPFHGGVYIFGVRGDTVLFERKPTSADEARRLPPLPLTDDAIVRNICLQAIANRIPNVAHFLAPYVLRTNRRFHATTYGHSYFQRSYARSYALLTSSRTLPRILRFLGVHPRLPVVHQTFVVPPERIHAFLALYFDVLGSWARLVSRLEQQDLIRLPVCPWPLHGSYGLASGSFLYTSSLSIPRGTEIERDARAMLARVTNRAWRELGVKTLLLKQVHGSPEVVRAMHGEAIAALVAMKKRVDPRAVLSSRFLERLLDATPSF